MRKIIIVMVCGFLLNHQHDYVLWCIINLKMYKFKQQNEFHEMKKKLKTQWTV